MEFFNIGIIILIISFDPSKPDGSPRKLLNSSRLNSIGWHAEVNLKDGLIKTYQDYLRL